jgi:hypothetical protein
MTLNPLLNAAPVLGWTVVSGEFIVGRIPRIGTCARNRQV